MPLQKMFHVCFSVYSTYRSVTKSQVVLEEEAVQVVEEVVLELWSNRRKKVCIVVVAVATAQMHHIEEIASCTLFACLIKLQANVKVIAH